MVCAPGLDECCDALFEKYEALWKSCETKEASGKEVILVLCVVKTQIWLVKPPLFFSGSCCETKEASGNEVLNGLGLGFRV